LQARPQGIAVQLIAAACGTIGNCAVPASLIFSSGPTDLPVVQAPPEGTYVPKSLLLMRRKAFVKDQVHIRNAEAAQLARTLARQTGKTIGEVVLDALRQYRPHRLGKPSTKELETWRQLLRQDREGLPEVETPIESLYDEHTGLPV
jgi:hypothetical protein